MISLHVKLTSSMLFHLKNITVAMVMSSMQNVKVWNFYSAFIIERINNYWMRLSMIS